MSQGLSKKDKLNTASEYSTVFSKAKRSTDRLFTVLAKQTTPPNARLGLAIAKKSVKKASQRNNIKRIVRESFRRKKNKLFDYDFVVMCRKDAALATKQMLQQSIEAHWKKLTT
ncbi:MAG: hypothetical protein A6F72_01235 [Cycloclasticus sp. symbiont of Poecilosclerida sp. N]|nr:MAG: hypothetical protein A6F72_01235 [Cycloclasticus sp. symbiont of Poecilosclerida sp. N]